MLKKRKKKKKNPHPEQSSGVGVETHCARPPAPPAIASPARPNPHHPEDLAPLLRKLSDDLLADILIRLPTLADLGRASAACPTFRRVIGDHSFLRRIRAIHPPRLLGILPGFVRPDFLPAQPPHPSAAVARAFADAVDFSRSFLPYPRHHRWRICDFRDGRALLHRIPDKTSGLGAGKVLLKQFAICDLLHRRYLFLVPDIPANLTAVAEQQGIKKSEPFLAPHLGNDHEGGSSFKVICLAECLHQSKLFIFTYSSSNELWCGAEFDGWNPLIGAPVNEFPLLRPSDSNLSGRDFAHGCFCWVVVERHKLLMLDTRTMEFSSIDIPPASPGLGRRQAIVEASEGRFGMFTVCFDRESGTSSLSYAILQNEIQSLNQWKSESTIQLPLNYRYTILGVTGGYLLLQGMPLRNQLIPKSERPNLECFSLNLKTFLIEPFCSSKYLIRDATLYAGLLPSLTAPAF